MRSAFATMRDAHGLDGVVLGGAEPDRIVLDHAVQRERIEELASALSASEARSVALARERDQNAQQLSVRDAELSRAREATDEVTAALTQVNQQLDLLYQTPLWRARKRLLRHPWLAMPVRRLVRLMSR
jgi:hypothetical protein